MYFKVVNGAVEIDAKTILEQVNIEIKEHDHIAIIGRNGAGKSTLLKALIDNRMFSEGVGDEAFSVTMLDRPDIGFLKQNEGSFHDHTLLEEIEEVYEEVIRLEKKLKNLEKRMEAGCASVREVSKYTELEEYYKNMGGYEYQKEYLLALNKNGFTKEDLHKKMSSFSGGEQTKISFIKLLLKKPDLLLLDEPTNHLDMDAILWLEEYLGKYPASFVVVSHDRMFINRVANKIYEIEYGETQVYHGNYDYYLQEKKRRYDAWLKNYEKQQKEIARLQRIADRFRYKPSKVSMAMSKLKQIERMVKIKKPQKGDSRTFHARFDEFKKSGQVVLTADNLEFGYHKILGKATFTLNRGRRLAIIGKNGTGKSTLLKTIMGIQPKLGGEISFGSMVYPLYFDQQFDSLDKTLTVYEEFMKTYPQMNDYDVHSSLASFMFYEEDLNKKIEVLSGGEKVRLQLCKLIFGNANLLVLDEPTNHLDILSKERLEEVLQNYPGTILFVSHDRYFIKKIADSILEIEGKEIVYYDYNYEDYLEKKKESILESKPVNAKTKKNHPSSSVDIDKQISKLEEKLDRLNGELFLEEVYTNQEKYQETLNHIHLLEEKLNELIENWE